MRVATDHMQGREHNVALALGQHFLIRLADCDTRPLDETDFVDNMVDLVDDGPSHFPLPSAAQQSCHTSIMIKHVELARQGTCSS